MSKLIHYAFDAVLISAVLAGAKRTAGLGTWAYPEWKLQKIENETLKGVLANYLYLGDWVLDFSISQLRKMPEWTQKK